MDWHDDVAAAMPEPEHPEEPADLRRDLVDEIADHLHCSLQRELLAVDGDESAARERVLARFGDVRKLLRKLWFDAWRERLVNQRVTMIAAVVLAIAGLAACGIAWSVARGVQATNRELLAKSEALQQRVLAEGREPVPAAPAVSTAPMSPMSPSSSVPPGWSSLSVKLVDQTGDRVPVGWRVNLQGELHSESIDVMVEEPTNDEGIADFGVVRQGNHSVRVTSPWHEEARFTVSVLPGRATVESVKCPSEPRPERMVNWSFEEAFREELLLNAHFTYVMAVALRPRTIGDEEWSYERRRFQVRVDGSLYDNDAQQLSDDGCISLPTGEYQILEMQYYAKIDPDWEPIVAGQSHFNSDIGSIRGLEVTQGESAQHWVVKVSRETAINALARAKWKELVTSDLTFDSSFPRLKRFVEADENGDDLVTAEEFDGLFRPEILTDRESTFLTSLRSSLEFPMTPEDIVRADARFDSVWQLRSR